ncbi:MAG: hypothetical protein PHP50_11310 [Lachnospiraceae bacterium]|nr:hypothetical protein [Lachnospiraceae bacterium]
MIYFLIVHLVICIAVIMAKKIGWIHTRALMVPIVILLPVWGVLLLLEEEMQERLSYMGKRELEMDTMKVQDTRYRHIEVEATDEQNRTIPLEDALLLNDTGTRRRLMLDILHKNPNSYIDLLKRTRNESDVEIAHYATSTMMKIQTDFEKKLQLLSTDFQENSKDVDILREYENTLKEYIQSGLISKTVQMLYRKNLDSVLDELVALFPDHKRYQQEQVDNCMELGNYEKTELLLDRADHRWPDDEAFIMLRVKYLYMNHKGEQIRKILDDIKERNVYLSNKGRKWYRFWSGEQE